MKMKSVCARCCGQFAVFSTRPETHQMDFRMRTRIRKVRGCLGGVDVKQGPPIGGRL